MIVGLVPELRGGLAELARTGQRSRFVDGYLRPYARAFDGLRYFSYCDESLAGVTDDPELRAKLRLFPGSRWHPWLYAFAMPIRYRREFRGCSVLRVFQVTGVIPALIAKRLFGVPFVTTYGFWYERLSASWISGGLRRIVARLGLRAADGVIVTTPELATHVARWVRDADRIHLVPNGVDTSRFRPVPRAAGSRRTILYVGRLAPEKDLETLVTATAKLVGRFDLRLVMVGEGPLAPRLERLAAELGVDLKRSPVVDHRDLPSVYAAADVFVLPSFTEGHPKVLLEAMSCGLPCVASDVGGSRTILSGGDVGLRFDPGDPGGLASAIERLITQEAFGQRVGARARQLVEAEYDLGALVGREIDLLRRVATDGRCGARA